MNLYTGRMESFLSVALRLVPNYRGWLKMHCSPGSHIRTLKCVDVFFQEKEFVKEF